MKEKIETGPSTSSAQEPYPLMELGHPGTPDLCILDVLLS